MRCGSARQRAGAVAISLRALPAVALLLATGVLLASSRADLTGRPISREAAESCARKVEHIQRLAEVPPTGARSVTRVTEGEVNSFLALELSPKYHPSLKSIVLTFNQGILEAEAAIDFDHLGANDSRFLVKLLSRLVSGVHQLTVRGSLVSGEGKGNFQLREARFDSAQLPAFLVEEIITSVGLRQQPPFDPMRPSQLPYGIQKVEVQSGHILVFQ